MVRVEKGFPGGHPDLLRDQKYYDQIYTEHRRLDKGYNKHWTAQVARTVTYYPALILAEPPILDVGCGAGHVAAMCRAFGIAYVAGIDYSSAAIRIAKERSTNHRFITHDIMSASELADEKYRTAIMLEVLEHVPNDIALIKRIPSGRIVVGSVPNFHVEGHCRWFGCADEVKRRYSKVLKMERVITEQGVDGQGGGRFFIFKGVRP